MTTKTSISNNTFINDIDALYRVYSDCANEFLNDKNVFFEKVAEFSKNGKNHLDLAKSLSWPRHLVKHIIEVASENFEKENNTLFNNFVADNESVLNEFSQNKEKKLTIFINLDDSDDFFVYDNNSVVEIDYPYEIPEYMDGYLKYDTEKRLIYIDVFDNGLWNFSLRINGINEIVHCTNISQKKEALEMLRCMKKYLC
jgi:hypothetical protein